MRKACFKSEVRMPSRPLSGLLTQTIFFPLIGGPGKMPSPFQNVIKQVFTQSCHEALGTHCLAQGLGLSVPPYVIQGRHVML